MFLKEGVEGWWCRGDKNENKDKNKKVRKKKSIFLVWYPQQLCFQNIEYIQKFKTEIRIHFNGYRVEDIYA